jgi:hypothetical protein
MTINAVDITMRVVSGGLLAKTVIGFVEQVFQYQFYDNPNVVLDYNRYVPPNSILYYYSGTHTGANGASELTDSNQTWSADELQGLLVRNVSDLDMSVVASQIDDTDTGVAEGLITGNGTNTVTATLAGGRVNVWDAGDRYEIVANINIGDKIFYTPTTVEGGTVTMSNKGVPRIVGASGTQTINYYLDDGTPSPTYTVTIQI